MLSGLRQQEKLFFAKHLATLLKGGIPLSEALKLMAERKGGQAGKVATKLLKSVENGQALADAIRKNKNFGIFFASLVEIGETSGTLEKSLDFLADKLTREDVLRKKVKAMLFYPAVVLLVSAVVGAFVSFFVLPKLAGIFSAFDTQLPLATRILLGFSYFSKQYGILFLAGLAASFVVVRFIVRLVPPARLFWHRLKFRLPFFGKVAKAASLSSLFRDLGVMTQSGLPLEYSLRIEAQVAENMAVAKLIGKLQSTVSRGAGMGREMEKKEFALFPSLAARMIVIGESSGKLEETFFYLANYFEDETDSAAKNGAAMLEPILLIFIGLVAGFVALAVILPIYTLTGSIHR